MTGGGLRWQVQPLGLWAPRPVTKSRLSAAVFRASWSDTLTLLLAEIEQLGGAGVVVIQVDVDPADVRRDGMLRTRARVDFPGVVVSFTCRHGPLSYHTDRYEQAYGVGLASWQANVRAVALGLGALRAVDRYGISGRGEQYTGWLALPPAGGGYPATRAEAEQVLATAAGRPHPDGPLDPAELATLWRAARLATHPDRDTGSRDAWDLVERAATVLGLNSGSRGADG